MRLIDADALLEEIGNAWEYANPMTIIDLITNSPAQSLQEHDNEVIEWCAKVCESLKNQDYCVDVRAGAEAIRALKGK